MSVFGVRETSPGKEGVVVQLNIEEKRKSVNHD